MKYASHRKTNTARFHFYDVPKIVKFIESKNGIVAGRAWGRKK